MITIKQNFNADSLTLGESSSPSNKTFTFNVNKESVVLSGGSTINAVSNDVTNEIQEGITYYNNYQIVLQSNDFNKLPTYTSSNEAIAIVDQNGYVQKVSDGLSTITIQIEDVIKEYEVNTSVISNPNFTISTVFNESTLGKHASDNVDDRLVGKTFETGGSLFSSQDHTSDVFIRNPDFWASDIDLTCISPSNSNNNARKAGVLVTPRHILIAAHYEYSVGTKVYFVSQDGSNTVYERTVVSKIRHPEYSPYFPDVTVCALDSDLPSDKIKPVKILSSSYVNHLVEYSAGKLPCLALDQNEHGLVAEIDSIVRDGRIIFKHPTDSPRSEFKKNIIVGDSGNPIFMILDLGDGPELVLLSLWTYGGVGSGTFLTDQISDINQMIISADINAQTGSTGYTITETDLSSFATI